MTASVIFTQLWENFKGKRMTNTIIDFEEFKDAMSGSGLSDMRLTGLADSAAAVIQGYEGITPSETVNQSTPIGFPWSRGWPILLEEPAESIISVVRQRNGSSLVADSDTVAASKYKLSYDALLDFVDHKTLQRGRDAFLVTYISVYNMDLRKQCLIMLCQPWKNYTGNISEHVIRSYQILHPDIREEQGRVLSMLDIGRSPVAR